MLFVGSPNWWSTIAPPVATFLESYDLAGKTLIPFYTHGGGGSGHIEQDIARLCPACVLLPGLSLYGGSANIADVSAWLKKLGIK